jgi:hypothetical protein
VPTCTVTVPAAASISKASVPYRTRPCPPAATTGSPLKPAGVLVLPPSSGERVHVVPPLSVRHRNSWVSGKPACATANRRPGSFGSTARCGSDGSIPDGTASTAVATRGCGLPMGLSAANAGPVAAAPANAAAVTARQSARQALAGERRCRVASPACSACKGRVGVAAILELARMRRSCRIAPPLLRSGRSLWLLTCLRSVLFRSDGNTLARSASDRTAAACRTRCDVRQVSGAGQRLVAALATASTTTAIPL